MKNKNYEKVINKNNKTQNMLALYILIEHGKLNLLNKEYYDRLYKDIEENGDSNSFLTKDYQKEILNISVKLAELNHNDIYDFIQNEIDLSNKSLEKEDDSPNYEY